MTSANVNDRAGIERLYPREAFRSDAAKNARGKAPVLHGVLIASEVSESGDFTLQRIRRQTGESDPLGDTRFLAPFAHPPSGQTASYGGSAENPAAPATAEGGEPDYDGFIDRIIETASRAAFKKPIGRHEPRLRGFHGG
jgi:hypothetical protein